MRKTRSVPLLPTILIIALLIGAVVWLWVRTPRFVKEGDVRAGGPILLSQETTTQFLNALIGQQRRVQEARFTDPESAIELADQLLLGYRTVGLARYGTIDISYFVALLLCYKADALAVLGRLGDAEAVLVEAVAVAKENILGDLEDSTKYYPLMAALGNLASHYFRTGDTAQALRLFDEAYETTGSIAWIEGAGRKKDEAPHYKYQSALTLVKEASMARGSPKLQWAKLEDALARVERGIAVNESAIDDHWRNLLLQDPATEKGEVDASDVAPRRVAEAMQYVMGNRIHGHCVLAQVLRDRADLPEDYRAAAAPEGALNAAKQALLCFRVHEHGRFSEDIPDPKTFELPKVLAWAKGADLSTGLLASPHLDHAQVRRGDLARAIIVLASSYGIRGGHGEAEAAIETAIGMAKEIGDARITAEALAERGRIFEAQGKQAEAISEYKDAISQAEDIVLVSALPALERHAFSASYRPIYDRLVRLLLERRDSGDVDEAFRYVEKAKSRLFLDMIGNHEVHPRVDDSRLERDEKYIRRGLQLAVTQAGRGDDGGDDSLRPAEAGAIEVVRKAGELAEAVRGLSTLDPEWYSMRAVATAGPAEIRKLLRDGEVVVEFHIDGPTLHIFAVSRSAVNLATVDLVQALAQYAPPPTRAAVQDFVPTALAQCINDAVSAIGMAGESEQARRTRLAKARTALQALYGTLLAPIEAALRLGSPDGAPPTLIIVPDGTLHFVPFAALLDRDGKYLAERCAVALAPSASAIQYLLEHGARESDGRAIIVANPRDKPGLLEPSDGETSPRHGPMWSFRPRPTPLPRAADEAALIGKTLSQETAVCALEGEKASEEKLRRVLGPCAEPRGRGVGPEILHFACHCEFDHDEPMFTMLVLGATDPDKADRDGVIEARDVMNWHLSGTDVVTLNVCESFLPKERRLVALSKLRAGGELVGLSRAFLYAGAASVIATMAEIPDEPAARVMPDFYKNRYGKEHLSKGESLRRAQLAFARGKPDSLDWASYVLVGDWR